MVSCVDIAFRPRNNPASTVGEKTLQCGVGEMIHIVEVYYGWTPDVQAELERRKNAGDPTACLTTGQINTSYPFAWINEPNMTKIINLE